MWNFGAVLRSFSHLHRRSGGLVLFQLPRDLVFKTTSSKFCASTSQEKSPALQKAEETQNPLNLWGHWFIEVDTRTKKHVGWWWLMMVDDGWWWLMTVDDGWWWLMMVDDGWWWLMMVDDGWWWLMLLGTALMMTSASCWWIPDCICWFDRTNVEWF